MFYKLFQKNDGRKFSDKIRDYTLTIITFYFLTYFVYRDFNVRTYWGYLILICLLAYAFFKILFFKEALVIPFIKFKYLFFILMVLLFFIFPNSRKDKSTISVVLMASITFVYSLIAQENRDDIKVSFKIIYIIGLVFGLFIIYFQIYPDKYSQYIYPLLPMNIQAYISKLHRTGYSVSIGGISYTLYVVSFSFFSTLSYILYYKPLGWKKICSYISLFLFFGVIAISGRRGELMSIVLSLILFFFVSAPKEKRLARFKGLISIFLVLILITIMFLPYFENIPAFARHIATLKGLFRGVDANNLNDLSSGRLTLYKRGWITFKNNPVFGIGSGNFPYVSSDGKVLTNVKGLDVHNIVLQTLAENGMVGFIMIMTPYLLIYSETLTCNLKIANLSCNNKEGAVIFSNAVSLQLQSFLLIVAMVDPVNYKAIFWVMFYIAFYLHVYSYIKINDLNPSVVINLNEKKVHINYEQNQQNI